MHLSKERFEKLSDISVSVGQVVFASVFVEPLVVGSFNWLNILVGIIFSVLFWWMSVLLIRI